MKTNIRYCIFLIVLSINLMAHGQNGGVLTLSLPNYLELVKQYHPLARQANLLVTNAEANTLMARGNFDPKLFYDFKNKFFDDKNYYSLSNGGLEIPTWFGISVKTGVENNNGQYLNPENKVPQQGLMYAQVSLPLLQGLIIDERRATLKQAKIFEQMSVFEQRNAINELLYKAGKTYWDWYLSYVNKQVIANAVNISRDRLKAVGQSVLFGDRPGIDTVEANIQLQDRLLQLQQAELEYVMQSFLLSNYLWSDKNEPITITENTLPDTGVINVNWVDWRNGDLDSLINSHPALRVYEFKLSHLAVERKWKQEKLKPNLQLNYNPLLSTQNVAMGFQNNYKWGLAVGFPVLLRKERGDLKMTNIKIANVNFETSNKRNELVNKTSAAVSAFNSYEAQQQLYSNNVRNYEQLWQSEKRLFDTGESSLFMINSREMSYINAQLKLNEIKNKNNKSALEVAYSFGLLGLGN
jgi:outer membrane protein TolC